MSTTEERLAYIRAEIERDLDDSAEAIQKEFDDNQAALTAAHQSTTEGTGISLTPDCQSASVSAESSSDSTTTPLEIDAMMNSRDRNNWIYQVDYYKPLEPSTSVGGALKNWLKQKIRRFIAPVIAPLVLDQNTFNASVTTSINMLSDNECKISEFIKKQESANKMLETEIKVLHKELNELKQENERLKAENTAARLEIIRARKRLHREMKLVIEELADK